MMRVALLLLLPMIAGCVGTQEDPPEPLWRSVDWDVEGAVDWWEHFSTAYQKRDAYLPANTDARTFLIEELESIGLDVEIRHYPACARGVCGTGEEPVDMAAIVGVKPGSSTDALRPRIGLVSHFDTVATTIEGAYDDASGVAASFHICKALMQVELERDLACIFFDAEEQGLEASKAYVADIMEGDEPFVYDIAFGYDMTGINWPGHPWKMYVMTGGADFVPRLQPFAQMVMDGLGYPESGVEVLDTHDRNSDERRFRDAGIPIYRFAGGRHAADYPEYHRPGDTVDYVYAYVGGRANFEAGFTTIVDGSLALIQAFDGTGMEGLQARYG